MTKFKIGDRVRIRPDTNSQFRSRIGVIENEPDAYGNQKGYIVKIEGQGFTPKCQILEEDLEAVTGK